MGFFDVGEYDLNINLLEYKLADTKWRPIFIYNIPRDRYIAGNFFRAVLTDECLSQENYTRASARG
jgi:hypothetical protein